MMTRNPPTPPTTPPTTLGVEGAVLAGALLLLLLLLLFPLPAAPVVGEVVACPLVVVGLALPPPAIPIPAPPVEEPETADEKGPSVVLVGEVVAALVADEVKIELDDDDVGRMLLNIDEVEFKDAVVDAKIDDADVRLAGVEDEEEVILGRRFEEVDVMFKEETTAVAMDEFVVELEDNTDDDVVAFGSAIDVLTFEAGTKVGKPVVVRTVTDDDEL